MTTHPTSGASPPASPRGAKRRSDRFTDLRPVAAAFEVDQSSRARRLLRQAVRMEAAGWRSIGRVAARVLTGRSWTPPGAAEFRHDSGSRGTLVAFFVVGVVEVVAVDLIAHPWPLVRIPLLVLGIWGALFMLGMLLTAITRPHAVGPTGIWLRHGGDVDLELPWSDIHSVTHRARRLGEAPALAVSGPADQRILLQVVDGRTNIEITFEGPRPLQLPDGSITAEAVCLYVDQPSEFMKAARAHLQAYESAAGQERPVAAHREHRRIAREASGRPPTG